MKYTTSRDGVARATVRIDLRLSKDQIESVARDLGVTPAEAVRLVREAYDSHACCLSPVVVNGVLSLEATG